ncbi:hypothetical protein L2E82_17525 [Cichorium intybus]|uniref:Uncharacterized protein n=1 Tax=Cichorium intybus TaxID=13427 RepID=A0ACB9F9B2_CICIN|nr:hypothetical protein L2E82_17525 [Cichorium intybus]
MADGDHKGELEDCPAIIALGPLFKLTEIHFWVDLFTGMPYESTSVEYTKTSKDDVICSSTTESSPLYVDTELSRQMNELGLPLSFCTNKEKRNGKVKGKRNDRKKVLHTHEETIDEINNNGINEEYGDWIMYWDDFYERNYYYNSRTNESTWDPPSGYVSNELKEMVFKIDDEVGICENDKKEENSGVVLFNELESDKSTDGSFLLDFSDMQDPAGRPSTTLSDGGNIVPKKRKKKGKKTRAHRQSYIENTEVEFEISMEEISPIINKYWCQRYLLFSKYDEGIKMDQEGWFSATPECIARHHAFRCRNGIIVDCFTGVGGNAIRFAPNNKHTIAIDIDPNKIEYAQHNATIYGVKDLIEFITADSFILAKNLKADTVFLSPPWGGPEYAKARNFDLNMLKPHNGQFLFNVAKGIAPRIVMFLPRNVDINQLAELALSDNPTWKLEVEKNFLNGKLKAITAYFTDPSLCETRKS